LKALHILQVCNRLPWPLNDGGNIATFQVTKALTQAGHHVTIAALNTLKHRQDPAPLREYAEVKTVEIDTTVSLWGLLKGLFSTQPYNVRRFWSQEFADLLIGLLRRNEYDIVQLEGSYMSLYSATIRQHSKARLVLRSHNVEHQIWERLGKDVKSIPHRKYIRNLSAKIKRFEQQHLHDYDGIAAITAEDGDFYRRSGFLQPVTTINGAVDLERFPSPDFDFRPQVCFLGSLEWLPNVEGLTWLLKEIWPQVHERHPEATLHIAGKQGPRPVQELLPKPPGVVHHGQVPDAPAFLAGQHIFLVPLHSGGGMRMKIVEAMGAGLCVLSTKVGAEGIAYTDGQDIRIADTTAEWVMALDGLLGAQADSSRIARAGRALAEQRYSTATLAQQFIDFYRGLLP
jgi:polysaccharide biosynthesis protein PslH